MSRTFKDRPHWVRLNDPKTPGRFIEHRHDLLGKPYYKTRHVLDENGEPQFTVETVNRYFREYETPDGTLAERPISLYPFQNAFNPDLTIRVRVVHYKRYIYERYIAGYFSETCTANEHYEKNPKFSAPLVCEATFDFFVTYDRDYARPDKEERVDYHRGSRRKENNRLRNLTKMFNAGDEDADIEAANINGRQRKHVGIWD